MLLIEALETIGDKYGVYGFSGYGRDNVEFFVYKDMDEPFGDKIKERIDKIAPVRSTRMGPAIRHCIWKLQNTDAKVKILMLLSDGRPQDHGYGRDRTEKEYAIHDTKMALTEARREGMVPFALTVDRAGPRLPEADVPGHGLRSRRRHRVAAAPSASALPPPHGVTPMTTVAATLTTSGIAAAFVATLIGRDSTSLYIVCAVVAAAGLLLLLLEVARRRRAAPWIAVAPMSIVVALLGIAASGARCGVACIAWGSPLAAATLFVPDLRGWWSSRRPLRRI